MILTRVPASVERGLPSLREGMGEGEYTDVFRTDANRPSGAGMLGYARTLTQPTRLRKLKERYLKP